MFTKEIDYTNRQEMVDFLKNHYRYWTMNSWNASSSYANNVKIYNLNLPKEIQDKAWDYACGSLECCDIDFMIQDEIAMFKEDTRYDAGFNGRSAGYLVMYDTDWCNGKLITYPGRGIDQYADFDDEDDWDISSLADRVKLVQRFDEMCDNIREGLIEILQYSIVEEYQTTTVTTHRRLVSNYDEE